LKAKGLHSVFHYVPLHSSQMGRRACRCAGDLPKTEALSNRLLRLPLWLGVESNQQEIIDKIINVLN
jgi:dTDP-4-amino-4,6-dideoxygalactose transaminase